MQPNDDGVVECRAEGRALWEAGEPTEYGIEVYTAGDCWALAWHVAVLTGGRLVTLGNWPEWEHVVVEVAPGRYVDATGVQSAEDLRGSSLWSGLRLVPMDTADTTSLEAYTEALGVAFFLYPSDHEEAAAFAARLVESCLTAA